MPSAAVADDENGATKPKTTPNIRRSPAKRTPRNGSTPTRKAEDKKTPTPNAAGTKARTPNSAPANVRRVSKKAEPTLLSDFLLGRPSPQRVGVGGRRKSLDVVKKEMKLEADVIGKVPHVGGVKDRVKQWQKANAAELVASKAEENKTGDSTDLEDGNSTGRDGDTNPRPGRRKSEETEDEVPNGGTAKDLAKKRSKSAAAPKKRVVSDDHWMRKPEKKKSPPRKGQPIPKHFVALTNNPPLDQKIKDWAKRNASEEPEEVPTIMTGSKPKPADAKSKSVDVTPRKGASIPANFLTTTNNPPLAKKIDDWIKRSSSEQYTHATKNSPNRETGYDTPSKRKPSSQGSPEVVIVNEEDTRRRKKSPRQEQAKDAPKSANPSRLKVSDDGIRVRPSPDPAEDDIQIKPGKSNTVSPGDDGIRIRPKVSDTSPREKRSSMSRTPQTNGRKERRPSLSTSISDSKSLASSCQFSDDSRDDTMSWTPSRKQSRRHQRKSDTQTESLAEIPLGNSAFSVLDLPVGAEAGTLRRRVPPKRTPSFSVPKVFKKVYNEARNIVHDTADQQRPGIANPPSIESWLNGTSDPFIDGPAILKTSSEALESPPGVDSLEDSHQTEADNDGDLGGELHTRTPEGKSNKSGFGDAEKGSSDARERLPSIGHSPANSPVNLKRTPATRGASSPKSARKTPLKDVFLDAFRGESTTTPRSKGTTQEETSEFPNSRSPQEVKDANHNVGKEDSSSQSPPAPGDVKLSRKREERQLPVFSKRPAPTTGVHRLSTIASVETFSTGSSLSETISELSKTTLTQDTHSTLPTESSLSRNTNNSGLKRRLTKHSDLLSVLSLPDPAGPEAGKTIRPARSVRTSRVRLETATIRGLMKELTDDEAKYLRELNTLVDGVIPVLLSSVLSKSKSAIAAGLFDANPGEKLDASFTKPIVDMGVALERLRSLHKRIPLGDPEAITSWAHGAYKTYSDYLAAWRMGFQDVVVNLAPASESPATSDPTLDTMPRNANGDVVDVGGERVDVAFLLKRPLNRVKYLAKICKGINKLKTTDLSKMVDTMWEELESTAKRRVKEENARMVDRAAANTDPTRARDPSTLALAEDTKIDRTRQVCAKDYFFMDMPHSTGQRIECQVELLLRDNPSDKDDDGDILICAVDNVSRWLLLTPLPKKYTSARLGDNPGQVVILVRGVGDSKKTWQETFLLQTDDNEAAAEWVEMLGKTPIPPALSSASPSKAQTHTAGAANTGGVDIPIGERRRREAEEIVTEQPDWQRKLHTTYVSISEDSMGLSTKPKDLNDAMRKAGQLASDKHTKARRRNSFVYDRPSTVSRPQSSGSNQSFNSKGSDSSSSIAVMSGALPYTPQSAKTAKRDDSKYGYQLASPRQHESPPAPPAHRTPITHNTLKTSDPALDSPTPRAKNRRTSSPLKHEYQPFDSPHTSDSDFSGEDSSSGTDEELEETEPPGYQLAAAMLQGKRENYLIPGSDSKHTPGQSNLTKQVSPNETPGSISSSAVKLTAMISCWSNKKGQWEDLHSEQCSIVVSPGLIEAFEMSASHSLPVQSPYLTKPNLSDAKHNRDEEANRPLLAIEITPFVNMRKSNGLDIEVHGAPKPNSLLKCKGAIRYRSPTPTDCNQLYNAIHKSRMEIPAFIELEKAGTIDPYGANAYETAVKGRFGRNFFGRRRSYRASARAPPSTVEPSVQSNSSSVFSRLRHLGSGGRFNIAKSTLDSSPHQGFWSAPGSVYDSRYSDLSGTPPGTPPSLSLAYSSNSRYGGNIGYENIKIRLYSLETNTRWDDKGEAAVTFSHPPHGMRQALAVNNGVENRVTVTLKVGKNEGDSFTMLDEVLGSNCFSRLGRTGVMFTVWEDIRGDGGEIGQIGRSGGVSGRTRKWLFQTNSQREAAWIYGLTQRSALTY